MIRSRLVFPVFRKGELADLKPVGSKVDKESVLDLSRLQITEDLSFMFGGQCLGGLQLDDQDVVDKQIRDIITNQSSVFVENLDWLLLLYFVPRSA